LHNCIRKGGGKYGAVLLWKEEEKCENNSDREGRKKKTRGRMDVGRQVVVPSINLKKKRCNARRKGGRFPPQKRGGGVGDCDR